jgi:hypothetical protein
MNNTIPNNYDPNWLTGVDKRTSLGRQLVIRYNAMCSDLGGEDQLSYIQKSLVNRYIWLEWRINQIEMAAGEGHQVDDGKWSSLVNSFQGLGNKLGLKRVTKDVKDLGAFLAERSNR